MADQDLGRSLLQGLVDGIGRDFQKERSATQMTLGQLIAELEKLPPERTIVGFGNPHSYRGYYSDLAFEPTEDEITVINLLTSCREDCMGQKFEGYKGGDFYMTAETPLWISDWGYSSGMRVMGLVNVVGEPVIWEIAREVD